MKFISLFISSSILLFAPFFANAQSFTLPSEIKGLPGAWITIVPKNKVGGDVKFKLSNGLNPVDLSGLFPDAKPQGIVVQANAVGVYEIWAWNAKGDIASDLVTCKVIIGDPPTPGPGPGPTPIPPGPTPIPEAGFRVLIVHESQDKLTSKVAAILRSVIIREYLNRKCVKVGNLPEYRFWERDQKGIENTSAIWQSAFKRERKSLPWIVISDGQKGFEGPLPESVEETLKLLKQYGGE